jgi:hypothetical protein
MYILQILLQYYYRTSKRYALGLTFAGRALEDKGESVGEDKSSHARVTRQKLKSGFFQQVG